MIVAQKQNRRAKLPRQLKLCRKLNRHGVFLSRKLDGMLVTFLPFLMQYEIQADFDLCDIGK